MFKLIKFLIKLIVAIAILVALVFAVARLPLGPLSNIAKTAEVEMMQIFDKNSVTKYAAQQLVDAESEALAQAMNITEAKAKELLSTIDIAGWKATTLPSNAVETKTIKGKSIGVDGNITLYSNSSYLTVNAGGQTVTLSVPTEAQKAVSYLYFL